MSEQKWNPEPWQHVHPRRETDKMGPYFHEITDANDSPVLDEPTMLQMEPERRRIPVGTMYDGSMDRAVACVNACCGIADPEAAIKAAREAMDRAEGVLEENWRNKGIGEIYEALTDVRTALALLGEGAE